MTTRGIDYAWVHPDPAALAAAGYTFACRYLSRDPSKNLTLAEAEALKAHGISVVANWEYGAQDMLRGDAGGVADAQLAAAQATAAGMPAGRPIYFSADWDVTPAQEATVLAYLAGADSVLGAGAVGEYGGFYPVRIARDHGVAWTWQSSGWSGGQWDARDTIRQTGSATVGGVQVDVNEAMTADFGQWTPGENMALTDADAKVLYDHVEESVQLPDGRVVGASLGNLAHGAWVAVNDPKSGNAALGAKLDAVAAAVSKFTAPTVDPAAVAAAVKAEMQDPAFLKALAHALAVELHNDTPAA